VDRLKRLRESAKSAGVGCSRRHESDFCFMSSINEAMSCSSHQQGRGAFGWTEEIGTGAHTSRPGP